MPDQAYLDSATAAPLHPAAREALLAALSDGWSDPARLYTQARRARQLLDAARAAVAECLGVRVPEVTFTANGTDAVRRAVLGGLAGRRRTGRVFAHSAIEHSAVLHAAEEHVSAGGEAVSVPVDRLGRIDPDAWRAAVSADGVALAALIAASHEVGTAQPLSAAAEACAAAGVPLMVDASVLVGRLPVAPGWSLLTASARKWGGPGGVGVLVVRTGVRFDPPGSAAWSQPERAAGYGPGAPDLPAIVAAAVALRAAQAEAAGEAKRQRELVDRIRTRVAATVPDVEIVGDPDDRAPHIVTFSCLYVDGESLLYALDRRGFAVSSGSSCTSSTLRPSHVLEAMGALSHGNVRVSLHRDTTDEQVERFLIELPGIVAELRAEAGVVGL
ncbi:cysteine desulfurase family protein [Hamadaea tsunoensis]|uniref:cysteine desulfurase family protein n=1 Tax=Hamadaea tsunoensis TaxID=53368 RepID=UPI00040E5E20|nr:aminotransferase class V-fold PLP-dependent enzyme [Hamadaea tsunoensis]